MHSESFPSLLLRAMVERQVPRFTEAEYNAAVEYTIRKYGMDTRDGALDLHGQNVEYIAELIAEAVGQSRIENGTLEITRAARELNQNEFIGRNETA